MFERESEKSRSKCHDRDVVAMICVNSPTERGQQAGRDHCPGYLRSEAGLRTDLLARGPGPRAPAGRRG
jgi:hypothetical protein